MSTILPLNLTHVQLVKRGKAILDDVDTTLHKAGFTIVMGPNGSGKTSLLRMINGLEKPTEGRLSWACDPDEARRRQALVFQTPVMMRRSAIENVIYPLRIAGHSRAQARRLALEWLERVGLSAIAAVNAKNLSGGERQKLAIARALACEPGLLLLDEPTANLDGRSTREIETILTDAFQAGTRIVMATHHIGQARRLATDVLFMSRGKIIETADAATFFTAAKSEHARAYLKGDIVE